MPRCQPLAQKARLRKQKQRLRRAPPYGPKFIIDKDGRVVERNDQSPKASEAKLKALLGV